MAYEFLREGWESNWAPNRNFVAGVVSLVVMNGPGLFWLYIFVDALRKAQSTAFWFGPTPTGETSVFAKYVGSIGLFVLWTALVLALFYRPLSKAVSEA